MLGQSVETPRVSLLPSAPVFKQSDGDRGHRVRRAPGKKYGEDKPTLFVSL